MAEGGDAYEEVKVNDAPPPPETKDDKEEGKQGVSFTDTNADTKAGGSKVTKSKSESTSKGGSKDKDKDESKSTKGGGKKKKKKKDKKKKKTAHFKKRGAPIFKVLTIVFTVISLLCLVGAVIFAIMLANEAASKP